jgi:hypothetical protein
MLFIKPASKLDADLPNLRRFVSGSSVSSIAKLADIVLLSGLWSSLLIPNRDSKL